MNTKSTPGPWKLCETWDQLTIEGPNGEEIIEQVGNYGTPAFKHDADARLAAAAPELLVACQDLLTHASLTEHMSSFAYERAKSAIEKALAN